MKLSRKIVIALFLTALFFNLYGDNEVKIVNGTATNYMEFKGVVGLITDLGNGYVGICTATFIDPEVLLTAGHCVYLKDDAGNIEMDAVSSPSITSVHNGATINYFSSIATAERIIKHEDWNGILETDYFDDLNDIALIKIDTRITNLEIFGLREDPIEEEGDVGTIVGYGISSNDGDDSGTHRKGTETIIDMNENRSKSFTADSPSNTCSGDSGGPFFTYQSGKYVISGVTSYHSGTCTTENEFVHVLSYREWIDENLRTLTGHGLDKICGNNVVESGETCEINQAKQCNLIDNSLPASNNASCNDYCNGWNVSECHVCGDGYVTGDETCDNNSVPCLEINSSRPIGNAICNSGCSGWDTSNCENESGEKDETEDPFEDQYECGNGVLEIGEQCDEGMWNGFDGIGCTKDCMKINKNNSGCSVTVF